MFPSIESWVSREGTFGREDTLRHENGFGNGYSRESTLGSRENTRGQERMFLREGSNVPSPSSTPRSTGALLGNSSSNYAQHVWKPAVVLIGTMVGVAALLQVAVFTGHSPGLLLARQNDGVHVAHNGGRVAQLLRCLSECLETSSRWTAARALGQLRAKEAIPDLLKAFRVDISEDVRMNAVKALGAMRAQEAVKDFREGLLNKTEAAWVQAYCAEGLGMVNAVEAMDDLRAALRSNSHRYVRSHSAWALGHMRASSAKGDLRRALREDAEEVVRGECAKALGKLGTTDAANDLTAALLHDNSTVVVVYAAEALSTVGTPSVIPELRKALLKSGRPEVRSGAAEVLGHLHAKDAVDDLIFVLSHDKKSDVRESAAFALGRLRCKQALGALITMMGDTTGTGLVSAAFAVTFIEGTEQGIKFLCGGGSADKVRLGAAEALGEMRATKALECLKSALKDASRFVQAKARKSIEMIQEQPGSGAGV